MKRPKQLRILGLLALVALGLHGGAALGHHHDAAVDTECIVCHAQQTALAVEPGPLESRLPVPAGSVVEQSAPAAQQTLLVCRASRGPPI